MFIHFKRIQERDRQKDGQMDTAWWHRPFLCIASCGKMNTENTFTKERRVKVLDS